MERELSRFAHRSDEDQEPRPECVLAEWPLVALNDHTEEEVLARAAAVDARSDPHETLQTMRDHQLAVAFVTDAEQRLAGAVLEEEVAAAATRGDATIEGLVRADIRKTKADAFIAELLVPAAESRVPIAVVDDDERLVGVVRRTRLLTALGGGNSDSHCDTEEADLV